MLEKNFRLNPFLPIQKSVFGPLLSFAPRISIARLLSTMTWQSDDNDDDDWKRRTAAIRALSLF
jgi:hypothetical protein